MVRKQAVYLKSLWRTQGQTLMVNTADLTLYFHRWAPVPHYRFYVNSTRPNGTHEVATVNAVAPYLTGICSSPLKSRLSGQSKKNVFRLPGFIVLSCDFIS